VDLEFLNFPAAPPPPPTAAYSHAVRAGEYLFVTGQLGVDPKTNTLVPGGTVAQTHQVMRNLQAVLAGAGTTLARAVMVRIYLTNFADYAAMNAAYASYFAAGKFPARTTVGVTALALAAAVEIDLIVRL
jgi:2-iminobutanoate/2-iminopropanoate deaminase